MLSQEEKAKQETSFRKLHHLEICLKEKVQSHETTKIEDFHLVHRAICDLDFDEIDTSLVLWGKKLQLPLVAAAMTGGHPDVRKINENVAIAAQKYGFAMGVGSQRAALEKNMPYITESFEVVRQLAPDVLLIANLGAAQFGKKWNYREEQIEKAINLIKAQAIAIHVNPGQEVIQIEGDTYFQGFWQRLNGIAEKIKVPIILKEVGSGFSREDEQKVENSPLSGIDIGGLGGTSWIGVETLRLEKETSSLNYEMGNLFWDWGIPTAISLVETRSVTNKTLIATGGIRNGMQAAKMIALGADIAGMALPFLEAAAQGLEELDILVKKFQKELKITMFLTGCKNLEELRSIPVVVSGYSKDWMEQRGIDLSMPWRKKI